MYTDIVVSFGQKQNWKGKPNAFIIFNQIIVMQFGIHKYSTNLINEGKKAKKKKRTLKLSKY